MKRKYFPILVILVCTTGMTHAQTTVLTNVRPLLPPSFLGWDGTGGIPGSLEIRNDFAGQPINFLTGAIQRMTILGTNGYVGIRTVTPIFPLDVRADGANNVTASGWKAGIHLSNHAALAWDNDGLGNFLFMGHPAFNADHSFYCGLAPGLGLASVPNYVYRIVDIPQPIFTSPNSGDMQFFHWVTIFKPGPFISDADQRFGVNTLRPDNTIEINTPAPTLPVPPPALNSSLGFNTLNGNTITSTGYSGLRFSDLTSASVPVSPAPSNNVLSVSSNGDVILVPGGGGALGTCATTPTTFAPNVHGAIDLTNNNNFYFIGNGAGIAWNNVVIGRNCTVPLAKLDVLQNSGSPSGSIGINVENTDLSGGTPATSVVGVRSVMPNSFDNFRIAGLFDAPVGAVGIGTAIFVPQNGGRVSIGYPSPYFNTPGLLEVNGPIYMSGLLVTASDESWKTNITNIDSATAKIKKLNGIYYYWDTINNPTMNFESRRQVGFVAQNVDSVLPELVRTDANGKKYVVYDRVVALLAEGMKEQQLKMDSLTQAIIAMQSQISSCCNSNSRIQNPNNNQTDVTLTNSESVVLNQNVPNPFAEQTTITYNLPESVQKAQLLFYDATGKLIKSVDLTARGNGQINVFANDLSNGIYSYALVVDGQIADTKRMVKTN